jgi:hypothetical protein
MTYKNLILSSHTMKKLSMLDLQGCFFLAFRKNTNGMNYNNTQIIKKNIQQTANL